MSSALADVWTPVEPDIMDIAGRLDSSAGLVMEEDALLCIQSGARRMVLDCRELSYITAGGLRAMLNVARAMEEAGGSFSLCGLQPQVEEMLSVTGIGNLISVYESRSEAIIANAA